MLMFLIFKEEYSFCGLRGYDDEWSISGYQCVTGSHYFNLRGRIRSASLETSQPTLSERKVSQSRDYTI